MTFGVRESIDDVVEDKDKLDRLMKAWYCMKERSYHDPTDPKSFWVIGGYHGSPFVSRTAIDELKDENYEKYLYWGGYCHHGNVLFPTWHRAYLHAIEKALQSHDEDTKDVMMPFWDETSEKSRKCGVPSIFTDLSYTFGTGCKIGEKFSENQVIDNPLRSFMLPLAITNTHDKNDDELWNKPAGYETVRYPLSGIVGNPKAILLTLQHNSQPKFSTPKKQTKFLNENVKAFLKDGRTTPPGTKPSSTQTATYNKFVDCLDAPNYTVFSNTSSANFYSSTHGTNVTSLEAPHNDIHLAVGGFDVRQYPKAPEEDKDSSYGQVAGANGDMGENNTAGLDPIFYFHHCFIDLVFWKWQVKHSKTDKLKVIDNYYGTSAMDSQGPTPEISPNDTLDMKTPLRPFLKTGASVEKSYYTSNEVINIEKQLDYTYGPSSMDAFVPVKPSRDLPIPPKATTSSKKKVSPRILRVKGLSRADRQGSFMIKAFVDGNLIGFESILSRGNVHGCANCLKTLQAEGRFELPEVEEGKSAKLEVEVVDRENMKTGTRNYADGDSVVGDLTKERLQIAPAFIPSAHRIMRRKAPLLDIIGENEDDTL